jgi:DNA invertase Pin-like site-specific DNA recombinase
MKIGYARVSTDNMSLQLDALQAAGCEKIFTDQLSVATTKRPGLDEALTALQPGDVLTVWRLDRLGRTMRHLVETVTDLAERGIGFQSLTEAMDTTTAGGELLFHVMGALAQFERRLNAERSRAGIEAARRRGKHSYSNKEDSIARRCRTVEPPRSRRARSSRQAMTWARVTERNSSGWAMLVKPMKSSMAFS